MSYGINPLPKHVSDRDNLRDTTSEFGEVLRELEKVLCSMVAIRQQLYNKTASLLGDFPMEGGKSMLTEATAPIQPLSVSYRQFLNALQSEVSDLARIVSEVNKI